jgi:hypothetical protein
MWIIGFRKEREQSGLLLLGRECNVGQAGCAGEDGQFLSYHVAVDGEGRDPMGRVVDHHLEAFECCNIARPGDTPRQLLERRSGDT